MSKQIAQLMHKYDIDDEELYGELFEELKQLKQQWQLEARIDEHSVVKDRISNRRFDQRGLDAMDERLAQLNQSQNKEKT